MTSLVSGSRVNVTRVAVPSSNPDDSDYIVSNTDGFEGVVNISDGNYTASGAQFRIISAIP